MMGAEVRKYHHWNRPVASFSMAMVQETRQYETMEQSNSCWNMNLKDDAEGQDDGVTYNGRRLSSNRIGVVWRSKCFG